MNIVYLNGGFLPIEQATISVLDRGFLLGDGIYEVIPVYDSKFLGLDGHLERLQHSLDSIKLPLQVKQTELKNIFLKLLEKNQAMQGAYSIYLQITRGPAPERTHAFPKITQPTLFATLKPISPLSYDNLKTGRAAITHEDIRWKYCHIKSISLLPTVLMMQKAHEANAEEAILIRDGYALEGTSSNVFIVQGNVIYTPPLSEENLSGVTRSAILKLAKQNNIPLIERKIKAIELFAADEVWISSSTRGIFPIIKLDNKIISDGKPGKIWDQMIHLYLKLDPALLHE